MMGFSQRKFDILFPDFGLFLISFEVFIGGLEIVLQHWIGRNGTKLDSILEWLVHF